CLAFAVAVTRGGARPQACPHLDLAALPAGLGREAGPPPDQERQLAHQLRAKVVALDLAALAAALGCRWDAGAAGLRFRYLGQEVLLGRAGLLLDGREPEDPRDQILLCNYVAGGGAAAPRQDWVGMESLPSSISKIKTLRTYGEERLAELFASLAAERLVVLAQALDGRPQDDPTATAAMIIPVLPRLPLLVLYWAPEPEEGFAARVKILFDRRVLEVLDLESLVFAAERLADRVQALAAASPPSEKAGAGHAAPEQRTWLGPAGRAPAP
ncbi:MAG: DUF3786 domain-containing protein, partial [Thermodesulfobacteriota bacterium]